MTELGCLAGDLESNSQWRQEQYRPTVCFGGPDRPTPTPSASYPSRSRRRSRRVPDGQPTRPAPLEVEQMPGRSFGSKPPVGQLRLRRQELVIRTHPRHLLRSLARPTQRADGIGLERLTAALAEQHERVINELDLDLACLDHAATSRFNNH